MIKITTVNVNGFRSREDQIRNYLANEGECVLALNDTRLNQNITNLAIPGYTVSLIPIIAIILIGYNITTQ